MFLFWSTAVFTMLLVWLTAIFTAFASTDLIIIFVSFIKGKETLEEFVSKFTTRIGWFMVVYSLFVIVHITIARV